MPSLAPDACPMPPVFQVRNKDTQLQAISSARSPPYKLEPAITSYTHTPQALRTRRVQRDDLTMYSPYGSYSSLSEMTRPMDIAQGSFINRSSTYNDSCAFPSWPQRSSLTEPEREQRATSYLSDDDLFWNESEDDAHSISSNSSSASVSPRLQEEELAALQRERIAQERRALQVLLLEQERRKYATRKQRRGSSKKSPKAKAAAMAPITEAAE